ncbi:MAG: hypothetical protein CME71_00375 [Halobacteriovorax sp.]|nr:hypothetical protein [Halobacteriovorax sp.]
MKLKTLRIKGFRSYGLEVQELELSEKANFIWGGNSQGKTGFTEAIEFLLTGNISRREMLSSSKDEFANSLRNAFLDKDEDVFVELVIAFKGKDVSIKRFLLEDYGKKSDCKSKLLIDTIESSQRDLENYGFKFNQPPLSTPILLQHCLSYLLTARPQDRADYFKAVFELSDIDGFIELVQFEISQFSYKKSSLLEKLDRLATYADFKKDFSKILKNAKGSTVVRNSLKDAMTQILGINNDNSSFDSLVQVFKSKIESEQAKAFPLKWLKRDPIPEIILEPKLLTSIAEVKNLEVSVDDSLKQFVGVYSEIQKQSQNKTIPLNDSTCPVCNTRGALDGERIDEIINFLKSNSDYQNKSNLLKAEISTLERKLEQFLVVGNYPDFIDVGIASRHVEGFTTNEVRKYVSDENLIRNWIKSLIIYLSSLKKYKRISNELRDTLKDIKIGMLNKIDLEKLKSSVDAFNDIKSISHENEVNYIENTRIIKEAIQSKISVQTNTVGWAEILYLSESIEELEKDLVDYFKFLEKIKYFENVLKDIDQAKTEVLASKFSELSGGIKYWWDLLRPEESSYFESVIPRSNTKRSIDFKVALQSGNDSESKVVLDAVAIFSQSQINCLGLSSFLAKMVDSKNSFVILDDPILSVDDEHRSHFIHDVIKELNDKDIQLILLTQDQKTWSSIQDLYSYMSPSAFQLEMNNPQEGTRVISKGDSAKAQLSAIKPLIRNKNSEIRKIAASK